MTETGVWQTPSGAIGAEVARDNTSNLGERIKLALPGEPAPRFVWFWKQALTPTQPRYEGARNGRC